jgi:hypothetical protein
MAISFQSLEFMHFKGGVRSNIPTTTLTHRARQCAGFAQTGGCRAVDYKGCTLFFARRDEQDRD